MLKTSPLPRPRNSRRSHQEEGDHLGPVAGSDVSEQGKEESAAIITPTAHPVEKLPMRAATQPPRNAKTMP